MKKLIVPVILSIMLIGSVNAQSPWVNDEKTSTIMLDWDKPIFNSSYNIDNTIAASSSVLFLTGRFNAANRFRIIVDVPISHYGEKAGEYFDGINRTSIGNVYLGGELDLGSGETPYHSYLEFGLRIPTASSKENGEGIITGMLTEIDRKEAFVPHSITIPVAGNFLISSINSPFAFKLHLGGVFNSLTDKKLWGDDYSTLHLLYGASALYRSSDFHASLGFAGRNYITGEKIRFWDNGNWNQLRGSASYSFGKWMPGIYVRKSVGRDYRSYLDWAYGITMTIAI